MMFADVLFQQYISIHMQYTALDIGFVFVPPLRSVLMFQNIMVEMQELNNVAYNSKQVYQSSHGVESISWAFVRALNVMCEVPFNGLLGVKKKKKNPVKASDVYPAYCFEVV